jgi:hypothetical protein
MKKRIEPVKFDGEVKDALSFLEDSFRSPKEKARLAKRKERQTARAGRRAVYDLDPETIAEIRELALTNQTTASQVAGFALQMVLAMWHEGELDLEPYKVRIDHSPRYRFILRKS